MKLEPERHVAELIPKLNSDRVFYFPVRHHSPVCAWHIRKWILENKPAAVLIEGPESITAKVELLASEECHYPVAVYTSFIDRKNRVASLMSQKDSADSEDPEPKEERAEEESAGKTRRRDGFARFAGFYPFCDYSPEMVAVRTGVESGARVRFIDLEYGEQILHKFKESFKTADTGDEDAEVRVKELTSDSHLKHSQYINSLVERMGCRDFDEMWDHLFESSINRLDTNSFVERLATYSALARLDYSEEDLRLDGTMAREQCMAANIRDELDSLEKAGIKGKVLVVTGGFHTAVLPDLVSGSVKRPKSVKFADDEAGTWLMRYSYDRLDSKTGYTAGMPSPAFYEKMWQLSKGEDKHSQPPFAAVEELAADIYTEISWITRDKKYSSKITTPDTIAAVEMTRQLALLRGHRFPLREDILDSIRACFIKGEIHIEGRALMDLVHKNLAGDRVGKVPAGTELPPIVKDFLEEASRLNLPVDSLSPKEVTLDLYKEEKHRQSSRLLHRLVLLAVPYARYLSGPDFVQGRRLDLVRELWSVAWSPVVESALIEASVYGFTVEEAAFFQLQEQIVELEEVGAGRSASNAVQLLIRALRLGLHGHLDRLVRLIDSHIADDPSVGSVVAALGQLDILLSAREPLEGFSLEPVEELKQTAYRRACRLLYEVGTVKEGELLEWLIAIQDLNEILAGAGTGSGADETEWPLDKDLYFNALKDIVDNLDRQVESAVVGAAYGVLFRNGLIDEESFILRVCGYLSGASSDPKKSAGIIRGLLHTASEVVWQVETVLKEVDSMFNGWDEDTFLALLPDLRLAFTHLTPSEVAKVAEKVASLHDDKSFGAIVNTDLTEQDLLYGLKLNNAVTGLLRRDHLSFDGGESP
ncbi:MAG: hypothetical protein H6677_26355 [Candidatus Obscuribacterales bacterium]|nr:hypothetical protein [Candidatus Obscuribacterales bacterium]